MSGLALGWAKKQAAPCAASKALLVLLGDYADEDGFAWPSIARMAAELQRSERHVSRLLKALTEAGTLYGFEVTDAGNGRTRPRVYFFPVDGSPPGDDQLAAYEAKVGGRVTRVSSPPEADGDVRDDTGVRGEGDTGVRGRVTRESSLEPPLYPERDLTISLNARAGEDDGFEAAMAAYPDSGRGVTNVTAAREAWALALTEAGGIERLTAAVRAYAADPMLKRRDYGAPSLQRWLGEGRWRAWTPEGEAQRRSAWDGPDNVRSVVADAMGPGAAASYVDPSAWDPVRRAVVTRTATAADRLRRGAGRALKAIGVSVQVRGAAHVGG